MTTTCLNNNTEIEQNFCANCGQKKYKRIDRKYIWDEVQYSTVHMNKGFFYSIKSILKNPGKTARSFIDGNRVNHYKPIALAFITSGILAFVAFKIVGFEELSDKVSAMQAKNKEQLEMMKGINHFFKTYISLLTLAFIPFISLFSKWSFKSFGHNFYEHVVMNAYILVYSNLLSIFIFYPLIFLFKDNEAVVYKISLLPSFSFLLILPYFYKNFYEEYALKNILKRVAFFLIMFLTASAILFIAGVIGYVIYLAVFDPETFKQFATPPAAK